MLPIDGSLQRKDQMRFASLHISNFRAITSLNMSDLGDVVVVAGPNGCGKSSILDAIRLLKTVYGGYAENEWQNWLSEFQIQAQSNPTELAKQLQDRSRSATVQLEIALSDDERNWLRQKVEDLVRGAAWRDVTPDGSEWSQSVRRMASRMRAYEKTIEKRVREVAPKLLKELDDHTYFGEIAIQPSGQIGRVRPSLVLETVFSVYDPQNIGIVDYHGAQRNYQREQIGGINLNIASTEQQLRQHALYNWQSKYSNIKSELAAGYIRELIAAQAGVVLDERENIIQTLKELFATFFPGKTFVGPEPTREGGLVFNVRTATGAEHDINELSAGEKEVLYGYLRLRNTAPQNSVLMIDEPELHLNPRLTEGLPDFYHRHLGKALNNQLWLVTHSDSILRQSVGRDAFKVFHMQLPETIAGDSDQLHEIKASQEVDRAIMDLVGDLAAYRPGAKMVIIEGGGDTEFDLRMIRDLFPDFVSRVNLLSGGNRRRVRDLQQLLAEAESRGFVPGRFYSIGDQDFGEAPSSTAGRVLTWDRFHIENYLLEPRFILRVLHDLDLPHARAASERSVLDWLAAAAESVLPAMVRIELEQHSNSIVIGCISTRMDRSDRDLVRAVHAAVLASAEKVNRVANDELTPSNLEAFVERRTKERGSDIRTGEWVRTFRGRDVLREFVGRKLAGRLDYAAFRDMVVSRMRDEQFQPPGMQQIISTIVQDPE